MECAIFIIIFAMIITEKEKKNKSSMNKLTRNNFNGVTDGKIQSLSISDFKGYEHLTEYLSDDILVAKGVENIPENRHTPFRLQFLCIAACSEGEFELEVNCRRFCLKPGDAIIILPSMIVSNIVAASKHKALVIGFSTQFLRRVVPNTQQSGSAFYSISNNPLIHHTDFNDLNHYRLYGDLIVYKVHQSVNTPMRTEILEHLFSSLLMEMLADIKRNYDYMKEKADDKLPKDYPYNRSVEIFRQFMKEVVEDNGVHRSLTYYADRLCYTPKYVSNIVKTATGRSALSWINEVAVEQIKFQLKNTNKSMKEIADEFEFPNQSFFGKYAKQHLGMSPARYREEARKE